MNRTNIMLLFGGQSTEHAVSVASAGNIYAALDKSKYDIALCFIDKSGTWHLVKSMAELSGDTLLPVLGEKRFVTATGGVTVAPDVLLPILHGAGGEDGTVQGLAQLLGLPVVGCGVLSSAMCMDKEITKRLLKNAGLHVADYILHRAHQPVPDFAKLTQRLGVPLFVKPASQGSSVGVSCVTDEASFKTALADAHKLDAKVLIEQAIAGREIECAVLGNDHPQASSVGEIKPAGDDFYSYASKYDPASKTTLHIPADLPQQCTRQLRDAALNAYAALECRGLARIDFFVTLAGDIVVNEINTLPGFTNISMYPKLWQHDGLSYPALLDKLIALALV